MTKIHNLSSSVMAAKKFQKNNKKIILVGGCFDILHFGHVYFLQKAKKLGGILMVLLESDETVKKLKGENRPIHPQIARAKVLEALHDVDHIVLLPPFHTNKEYDELVLSLKPAIIATTKGDLFTQHKKRQAKTVEAKVVGIKQIKNYSTSKLAQNIANQFYL